MNTPDLVLYLGGTRSGKSERAEAEAGQLEGPILYVATAEPLPDDPAMQERIRRHRARRPSCWQTLECPLHLAEHIAPFLEDRSREKRPRPAGVLLDCVTLWVSNILFSLPDPGNLQAFEAAVTREVEALLALAERSSCRWIVVSGETGLGGIAADTLTRNFADGLGLANQLLAARARKAFLVVAGRLLELAP